MSAVSKTKRHVYKTGAAGCGGKSAPVNAKNSGQPIPCPFCDRIFKQDGRFKDHLKNKHPNEETANEDKDNVSIASSSHSENPPSQQHQSTYPVKMPKALLHEWCQKNKRPSPKFMHVEVEGGFQCRVILPDPKKSELDIILWYRNSSPNSQEAHHRAAVMALHHVMGDRRLDRILPEEYRQEWHNLDAAAAEREERLKQKAQKPKRAPHAPRELQSVFMSERNRKLVEEVLTDKANGISSKEADAPRGDIDRIAASLLEMGFQESHVLLALEQTHDISAALDWLMLHVDESELPTKFAPQSSKAAVRIIQRITDYDVAGKLVEYGYTYEDSLAAYNETGDMELALSKLFYDSLTSLESRPGLGDICSEDVSEMKQEELIALCSIFPGAVIGQGLVKFHVELPPQMDRKLEMEVRISADNKYPLQVPVIGFRGKNWDPLNIRRLTLKVAERGLQLLGSAMLYDLLSYATELASELLLYPTRYAAARVDDISMVEARDQVAQVNQEYHVSVKQRQRRNKHMDEGSGATESLRLKKDWETLQASAQYADVSAARKRLPVFKQRNDILACINRSSVSIICGETGCGKSTQVPQYVLEESIETGKGAFCNVICTQPRRISALGLATRVAKERNDSVGKMVGYSVRLDSCCSKYTRLLYCTTGILLRRLLSDPELEDVSHIILDEVHERTLESDLLLLLLKNHIQRTGGTFRLILMSATADANMFADYFKQDLHCNSTILRIPGFTFPVRELYLEDVLELTGYRVTRNSKYAAKKKQKDGDSGTIISSLKNMEWEEQDWETDTRYKDSDMIFEYSEITKRSLDIVDESIINFELIEKVLCKVFELEREPSKAYGLLTARHEAVQSGGSSVLVFLPGMLEIKKLQTRLQSSRELAGYGVDSKWILPLHGSLSGEEQKRVFLRPPHSVRKIVLATNVAETSITIDDILYVIDTGRHKEMSYDHYKGLSCLQETWISKASSKQRCGRAGRVQPGCCLRLVSRKQFESLSLQEQQLPEIQRASLEGLCLKVKSLLTEWRVESALSKMLSPPDPEAVSAALQSLKDINAFDMNGDNLTPLGKHLAQMPVDARVGKMLIFGCMLKCLDPVLTIAAAMSGRSVFISSQEARVAKQRLTGGSKSDHIALVSAYNGWLSARSEGYNAEKQFCTLNFLSREALSGIEVSRQDYLSVLKELGFCTEDSNSGSARVIKAVVCAGFYPNVARVRHPEKTYVQTEGGTVPKLAAAHEVHYFTKLDGRVFLHPTSVNFSVGHYESPWLVITDKVKTSKVYVRECSMVPAYALLLFGGVIEVRHEKQMLVVDGWVEFEAPARIAVLIKELRKKVDALLLEKTSNPSLDISTSPVVSALLKLLDSDGGA